MVFMRHSKAFFPPQIFGFEGIQMFYGFVDFQAFHEKKKSFQILKYLHKQNRKKTVLNQ